MVDHLKEAFLILIVLVLVTGFMGCEQVGKAFTLIKQKPVQIKYPTYEVPKLAKTYVYACHWNVTGALFPIPDLGHNVSKCREDFEGKFNTNAYQFDFKTINSEGKRCYEDFLCTSGFVCISSDIKSTDYGFTKVYDKRGYVRYAGCPKEYYLRRFLVNT